MAECDPESFEDYYELLGVDRTADRGEIVAAYRDLVSRYHPDVADRRADDPPDEATTAHLFTHLARAREILSTEARRAEYDRLGHERYLLEHLEGSTLTPADGGRSSGASDPARGGAGGPHITPSAQSSDSGADPAWYRAASIGPVAEPITGGASDRAQAGESDSGSTITDLVDRDPLETAWVWFRHCWFVRGLVAVACLGTALLVELSAFEGVLLTAAGVALVVALTGGYALLGLPRATDPTTPPPNASTGLLRPSSVRRLRRLAIGLLSVATGLALVGGPGVTHSLHSAVGTGSLGTPWVPPGVLGAPKLLGPLNTALAATFVLATVLGTLAALLCLSAGAWLAVHGGHRSGWPLTRDLLAALAAVAVTGFAVPGLTGPAMPSVLGPIPPAALSALGIVDSAPGGVTLGLLGTLVLLVALVNYDSYGLP